MNLKNKSYTITIIFMAAMMALLGFLVYGIRGAIVYHATQIASERKEVAALQMQNKAVNDFKAHYKSDKANLEKISHLFVDGIDPINFITFLELVSVQANVGSDISIGASLKSENTQHQKPITFLITVVGDFANIVKFSEQLEAGPYLVNVMSVTIKKIQKDALNKKNPQGSLEAYFIIEALPK